MFVDVEHSDRRGWRLFADDELDKLEVEVGGIQDDAVAQEPSRRLTEDDATVTNSSSS